MASFSVKVGVGATLKVAYRNIADGGKVVRQISDLLVNEATAIKEEGEAEWPRTYNTHGNIVAGSAYAKVARAKQHNLTLPSALSFVVEMRAAKGEIRAVILSRAAWAYAVRSYQVGESKGARSDRFRWVKGTSVKRYDAQKRLGRKQHAWSVLFVRPYRRRAKALGPALAKIIAGGI